VAALQLIHELERKQAILVAIVGTEAEEETAVLQIAGALGPLRRALQHGQAMIGPDTDHMGALRRHQVLCQRVRLGVRGVKDDRVRHAQGESARLPVPPPVLELRKVTGIAIGDHVLLGEDETIPQAMEPLQLPLAAHLKRPVDDVGPGDVGAGAVAADHLNSTQLREEPLGILAVAIGHDNAETFHTAAAEGVNQLENRNLGSRHVRSQAAAVDRDRHAEQSTTGSRERACQSPILLDGCGRHQAGVVRVAGREEALMALAEVGGGGPQREGRSAPVPYEDLVSRDV